MKVDLTRRSSVPKGIDAALLLFSKSQDCLIILKKSGVALNSNGKDVFLENQKLYFENAKSHVKKYLNEKINKVLFNNKNYNVTKLPKGVFEFPLRYLDENYFFKVRGREISKVRRILAKHGFLVSGRNQRDLNAKLFQDFIVCQYEKMVKLNPKHKGRFPISSLQEAWYSYALACGRQFTDEELMPSDRKINRVLKDSLSR